MLKRNIYKLKCLTTPNNVQWLWFNQLKRPKSFFCARKQLYSYKLYEDAISKEKNEDQLRAIVSRPKPTIQTEVPHEASYYCLVTRHGNHREIS